MQRRMQSIMASMDKPVSSVPEESLLDEAIADTFPASDPVAIGHCERPGCPVREFNAPRSINPRSRKFIGTIATVGFLIIYSLVAMAIGGQWVVGRGLLIELPFYIVAGALWLPVAMLIVRWMSRLG
jgi:hypothetical protein